VKLRRPKKQTKCVFISVINQLDAQNFYFTISLFVCYLNVVVLQ